MKEIGRNILRLRTSRNYTQADLAKKVYVTSQAVSNWERGETLMDLSTLVLVADALDTTIDMLINGEKKRIDYRGTITVSQIAEGIDCIEKAVKLLGRETKIADSIISGINTQMNTEFEKALTDEYIREIFIAEAIIQNLMNKKYIDPADVRKGFKFEKIQNIVLDYAAKVGIEG